MRPLATQRRTPFLALALGGLIGLVVLWLWIPRSLFQASYATTQVYLLDAPSGSPNGSRTPLLTSGHSMTAILPINSESLPVLERTLFPFFTSSSHIREIIIICPERLLSRARVVLRRIISSHHNVHPDFSLHPLIGGLDSESGSLNAASQVSTDWVLIMDSAGLLQEDQLTIMSLLRPPSIPFPTGPRGISVSKLNSSCIVPTEIPQIASYLHPPFVMPSFFASDDISLKGSNTWAHLGQLIAASRSDGVGGIVVGSGKTAMDWCAKYSLPKTIIPGVLNFLAWNQLPFGNDLLNFRSPTLLDSGLGVFAIFLGTLRDLQHLSTMACMLQNSGHSVRFFVYASFNSPSGLGLWQSDIYALNQCFLSYSTFTGLDSDLQIAALDWVSTFHRGPDIILAPRDHAPLEILSLRRRFMNAIFVRIPEKDFPYCGWMGTLSIDEWRNWNIPRIDISIITKDRPKSLARLLLSLSRGRFFGDSADLRVYLEQSSDVETMKMVEALRWTQGSLFVHHRVIHGGLLPAVVESWYPHTNDTYGLLLEDDIELSPLFYAWAKMSLLRYRYGDIKNRSPHLFGISLYQQKNVELPPQGRRPFNPRTLFFEHGLADPSTPYLSPVPCSWGAVYFPEQWREFHAYISPRLSENFMKFDSVIVPDVRSNKWTKSWKKYFIELAYLRGYVMLYPNYENFMSLSTNHLEVGSHVKTRNKEKKELFILPLMQLPMAHAPLTSSLLALPSNTLPSWKELPVLNLTGFLTSLKGLEDLGRSRRFQLTGCTNDPAPYDIRDLLCIRDNNL